MAKVFRILGWVWSVFATAFLLISCVGLFHKGGFRYVQEIFNPFNSANFIAILITFGPGIILFQLSEAVEEQKRRRITLLILAFIILVSAMLGLGVLIFKKPKHMEETKFNSPKTLEYKAEAVRVLNRSAEMREHKRGLLGMTMGPVGHEGIPDSLKLDDTITINGKSILVRHIFVTEHLVDMRYGSEVLARKGDVRCIAVESTDNLPWVDEHQERDRLWISIEQCKPLSKKDGSETDHIISN